MRRDGRRPLSAGLFAAPASAHHSYAMYDGKHLQSLYGRDGSRRPERGALRDALRSVERRTDALVRDEKGEPLVWVVQMESAARAFEHGITRESFPQGTVVSMGVHPRRDGKPAGDRGESGLFQCPKGKAPEPGKHCDSVEGSKAFGEAELPPEGPVER